MKPKSDLDHNLTKLHSCQQLRTRDCLTCVADVVWLSTSSGSSSLTSANGPREAPSPAMGTNPTSSKDSLKSRDRSAGGDVCSSAGLIEVHKRKFQLLNQHVSLNGQLLLTAMTAASQICPRSVPDRHPNRNQSINPTAPLC